MEESIDMKCEIVTPEGLTMDETVEMVVVPGELGELGILPRHAPIVSRTVTGEARVKVRSGDNGWEFLAVGNGYMKVQFDRLLLLVDTAEKALDIDTSRAQKALERAEKYLARAGEEGVDTHRAEQSRKRAANRLKVAGKA
ncbi:MAG: ATP synthase F1 subunit epsilon [Thermoleophilia bacterium]